MRFKASFSLYRRRMRSGKVVFYFQCYDENGRRVCGHSTGQSTKTAAREYCNSLLKQEKLVKERYKKVPTLKEFAEGFWDVETSEYLVSLRSRKPLSKSYPDHCKATCKNHVLPKFGFMRLDGITEEMVDSWLLSFPLNGLSPATGNNAVKVLRIMLAWAKKKKLIKNNPCANVEALKEEEKERELLENEEVKKLFGCEWEKYWEKEMLYFVNKLAACTGMRIGELLGLKGEFVVDNKIIVNGQYGAYGYTDTKTHKSRCIPVPNVVLEELYEYKRNNGNGYLFSTNGGEKPISRSVVTVAFRNALTTLGISREEQKRRGLTFHSWRHFCNTSLLLANVPLVKVQKIIGHLSNKTTKRYTQIKGSDLDDVATVQEGLLTAQ
jgi:integrase